MKDGWRLFRKSYRNATDYYALYVDEIVKNNFGENNDLCEYIGEHTDGGHNYGYEIKCYNLKDKPTKIPPRFKPSPSDELKILLVKEVKRLSLCVHEIFKRPIDKKIKRIIDKAFNEKKTRDEMRMFLLEKHIGSCTPVLDYLDTLYGR
jgi:hypothetical protein